jgi:hypothetical protein
MSKFFYFRYNILVVTIAFAKASLLMVKLAIAKQESIRIVDD